MYAMRNPVRRYDWGSTEAIPELLGVRPDGGPQAELWIGAHETGPSSVLELVEREPAEPGPGEVRVRLERAGVNPTDWKFRAGMMTGHDEVTPGQDGSGVVDAVGEGVTGLDVGQRVWLVLAQHGRAYGTAAAVVALAAASASPSVVAGRPSCTVQPLSPAYAGRVRRALGAKQDVWGNALIARPNGPTYESVRRLLKPLLFARSKTKPLTTSGVYYLPFAQPLGVRGARTVDGRFRRRLRVIRGHLAAASYPRAQHR